MPDREKSVDSRPDPIPTAICAAVVALTFGGLVHTQVAAPAPAQPRSANAIAPGELLIEPPTLINIGLEWFVQGDANRNAAVTLSYRKAGTSTWLAGMPLLRLMGERIYAESRVRIVQPLRSSTARAEPALTIGSIVRTSPSVSTSACDGS